MPQVIEAIYYAVDRGFKLPIVYNTSSYDSVKSIELLDGLVGELGGQHGSYERIIMLEKCGRLDLTVFHLI